MEYNKARAEKHWKKRKDKEEQILRHYGVSEEIIRELYIFDWMQFNSDRVFRKRQYTNSDLNDDAETIEIVLPINNMRDLLEQIENEKLYLEMITLKQRTLDIIYLKICGFTTKEVATMMGVTQEAIRKEIRKIRKKLK